MNQIASVIEILTKALANNHRGRVHLFDHILGRLQTSQKGTGEYPPFFDVELAIKELMLQELADVPGLMCAKLCQATIKIVALTQVML